MKLNACSFRKINFHPHPTSFTTQSLPLWGRVRQQNAPKTQKWAHFASNFIIAPFFSESFLTFNMFRNWKIMLFRYVLHLDSSKKPKTRYSKTIWSLEKNWFFFIFFDFFFWLDGDWTYSSVQLKFNFFLIFLILKWILLILHWCI